MSQKKLIFVRRFIRLFSNIKKNLIKDFQIELRNRSSFNISLAFATISTLSISLAVGSSVLSAKTVSIFFWIILFFSAMNGLSHIFVREEEQGTALFLRINSSVDSVYFSKLIFNVLFFLIIQILVTLLFLFFFQIEVKYILLFVLSIFSGGLALSSSTTILGAMVAKAGGKGALFTVISFPIILPVLWVSIAITESAIDAFAFPGYGNVIFLLSFSGFLVLISTILFKYIWVEG